MSAKFFNTCLINRFLNFSYVAVFLFISCLFTLSLAYAGEGERKAHTKKFNNKFKNIYEQPLLTDDGYIINEKTHITEPGSKETVIDDFHERTNKFWESKVDNSNPENPTFKSPADDVFTKTQTHLEQERKHKDYPIFKNAINYTLKADQERFLALAGARIARIAAKATESDTPSTIDRSSEPYLSGKERLLSEPSLVSAQSAQSLVFGGKFTKPGKTDKLVRSIQTTLAESDADFKALANFQNEDASVISHYKDKKLTPKDAEKIAFGQVIGSIAGPAPFKPNLLVRAQLDTQKGKAADAGITNPDEAESLLEQARNKFCGSMENLTISEAFKHHYAPAEHRSPSPE